MIYVWAPVPDVVNVIPLKSLLEMEMAQVEAAPVLVIDKPVNVAAVTTPAE